MIWQLAMRTVLIIGALALGGCFFSDTPILLPVDSNRLPGGEGVFQALEENQEKPIMVQISRTDASKHQYLMIHTDEDGEQQKTELLFKNMGGEFYLVQLYADNKYAIISARIDENSLRFFEYDENTFEKQLKVAGLELLTYKILSNNTNAEKKARALQKAGQNYAIKRIGGYTVFGDRDQTLKFASQLATSQSHTPTSDRIFKRVR